MTGNSEAKPRNTRFSGYLRTGRIATSLRAGIEKKFNPWHDPEDGRFTFDNSGNYFGGGGSYGGAGASGGWSTPSPPGGGGSFGGAGAFGGPEAFPDSGGQAAKQNRSKVRQGKKKPPGAPMAAAALNAAQPASDSSSQAVVEKNGYTYRLDEVNGKQRTAEASGQLDLSETAKRSRSAQAAAGGEDRLETDDGGHFIASRFNGPGDWFNHFAQNANFNRGAYRDLENGWAKSLKDGHQVFVDIVPHYQGGSTRPDSLRVTWYVDGAKSLKVFRNAKGGK